MSFNEINSKNDQTDNIYAFALQTLPIKIINAIILYYIPALSLKN